MRREGSFNDAATILKPVTGLKVSLRESEHAPSQRRVGFGRALLRWRAERPVAIRPRSSAAWRSCERRLRPMPRRWRRGRTESPEPSSPRAMPVKPTPPCDWRSEAALNPTIMGGMDVAARAKAVSESAAAVVLPPLRPGMTAPKRATSSRSSRREPRSRFRAELRRCVRRSCASRRLPSCGRASMRRASSGR
jgi:hypothetical protein